MTDEKRKPRKLADPVEAASEEEPTLRVRRIHRRDLNRVWEFLKLVFRDVNRETVEYQRPRSKRRFLEVYEEEGIEQLLFEVQGEDKSEIVGYAECAFEITGSDNWMNERYFAKHDMRPLFVEELAVHTGYQGRGIGGFLLEQLEHLARVRGCTHLVLEVAENNERALNFYKTRSFYRLDAAIFLAKKVAAEDELLPPRALKKPRPGTSPAPVRTRKAESGSTKRKTEPPKAATKRARKTTVIKEVPLAPSVLENLSADATVPVPAPVETTPPSSVKGKKPEGGG